MQQISTGIVTIVYGNNYGCILQRYALQTALQRLCFRVESLNYDPNLNVDPNASVPPKTLNRLFHSGLSCRCLYKRLQRASRDVVDLFFCEEKQKVQRTRVFKQFENRFLINTNRYNTYDEVSRSKEYYDVLVAGSDQIWNPTWYSNEAFYKFFMLDFASKQQKISYAASIGLSKLPENIIPKFKQYLSDFSWISVRENEGAKELERILNRPVDVVLDPTMLLSPEKWDVIANQYPTNELQEPPYILCYSLGNQDSVVRKARQIQKHHKMPIICLCATAREYVSLKFKRPYVKPLLNVGPGEFVSLFKNSVYVVTDSFHGSVFSILFHKSFFTMLRDKADPTRSMNSRMTTLFSTFHLESRLFSPEDKSPLTPESFVVDYEAVDKILQERREYSVNKLREAIENVVKNNADA